jgi:hypothetical protein
MQWLYLILAIIGAIAPGSYLLRFLSTYGWDIPGLITQLFSNHISTMFGLDVIISGIVLFLFIFLEGRRLRMKNLWAMCFVRYQSVYPLVCHYFFSSESDDFHPVIRNPFASELKGRTIFSRGRRSE